MIIHKREIVSTNKYALELLKASGRNIEKYDNCMVTADIQSGGRGRRGRNWHSPKGGLYATFIITQPEFPVYASLWLCGLAVLDVVINYAADIDPWLKWPNDIYVTNKDKGQCKIAGLLAETYSVRNDSGIGAIVCGVGVNLNMPDDELLGIDKPATSLFAESGKIISVHEFAEVLYESIKMYRKQIETDFDAIYRLWKGANRLIGLRIGIKSDNGNIFEGLVRGVQKSGALSLELADGNIETIVTGDILFI